MPAGDTVNLRVSLKRLQSWMTFSIINLLTFYYKYYTNVPNQRLFGKIIIDLNRTTNRKLGYSISF
jgi:hypothetical protein